MEEVDEAMAAAAAATDEAVLLCKNHGSAVALLEDGVVVADNEDEPDGCENPR